MVIYFSGTGNSRYCAQMAAHILGDSLVDSFEYIRDQSTPDLSSQLPWVFVCPVYSWRMPRPFEELIRRSRLSGSRDVYFIMTCGSETGNAQKYAKRLCQEKGLHFRGLLPVIMPDNYILMFDPPDASQAKKMIDSAASRLRQGIGVIQSGGDLPEIRPAPLDNLKSGIVNTCFYRYYARVKPFYTTDACIGCGKCESVCPLGSVHMSGSRPSWSGECTLCMSCICGCPEGAIEYGRSTRSKKRYQCPVKFDENSDLV